MKDGIPAYLWLGSLVILLITGWASYIYEDLKLTRRHFVRFMMLFLVVLCLPSFPLLPNQIELSGGFLFFIASYFWLIRDCEEQMLISIICCSFVLGSLIQAWFEWNHHQQVFQILRFQVGSSLLLIIVTCLATVDLREKLVLVLGSLFVWEGWMFAVYRTVTVPYLIGSNVWMDITWMTLVCLAFVRWVRVEVPRWKENGERSS